jgi:hypothetical protein
VRQVDPQPRCECGKVIFLHPERAAFAAVQQAVIHGVPTHFYQCRVHEVFWHLMTLKKPKKIRWLRRKLYGQTPD